MKIKTKKKNSGRIIRLESFGEIKEIIINQDFLNPSKVFLSLCFRGNDASGIVELSPEEIDMINKEVNSRKKLFKRAKIMKFEK